MDAPVYVDLLLKTAHLPTWVHCSFLMGSAQAKGSTIAEPCETPGTTYVVSHTNNNSSIKSLHWLNPMVYPPQITKYIFIHKCSKLVKLAATPQLANL